MSKGYDLEMKHFQDAETVELTETFGHQHKTEATNIKIESLDVGLVFLFDGHINGFQCVTKDHSIKRIWYKIYKFNEHTFCFKTVNHLRQEGSGLYFNKDDDRSLEIIKREHARIFAPMNLDRLDKSIRERMEKIRSEQNIIYEII